MAAFPSRSEDAFMTHWKTNILGDDSVGKKTILLAGEVAGNIVSFGEPAEREVGYWIGKEYWGKGVASNALALFLELEKTRPLHAHVAKHNTGSVRVLEKCGFKLTGTEVGNDGIDELDFGLE